MSRSRWYMVLRQEQLLGPVENIFPKSAPPQSKCNKPLALTAEEFLNILTYFHLQEYSSGRVLIQPLQGDTYARSLVAPADGIKRSTFSIGWTTEVLRNLFMCSQDCNNGFCRPSSPSQYVERGDLVTIDGSLLDPVLEMHWANMARCDAVGTEGD